jgi:hypothetical protein
LQLRIAVQGLSRRTSTAFSMRSSRPSRAPGVGPRRVDAVILSDEPNRHASIADYPTLKDRNVIVVQTKAERMGMYLMGQALFSARLARRQGAKSVRSILLCTALDSVLLPLLRDFPEVEVWVYEERSGTCRRAATT